MQTFKNVVYYVGWSVFWITILVGAIFFSVETKTIRFTAPIMFLAFIGYAFYAMLKTRPALPSDTSEEKESPTLNAKDKAGSSE